MMRYNMYGFSDFGYGGPGIIETAISIVILVDLILVGLVLWKKLKRDDKCCHDHGHDHHHDHEHGHELQV